MSNLSIEINGTMYDLSTKLRVAYKVQEQNAHKPYTEVFQQIDSMPIEKQIDILYAAFEVANPDQTKIITRKVFLDWYLDECDVSTIMTQLQAIIGGILGKDLTGTETAESIPDSESAGN